MNIDNSLFGTILDCGIVLDEIPESRLIELYKICIAKNDAIFARIIAEKLESLNLADPPFMA